MSAGVLDDHVDVDARLTDLSKDCCCETRLIWHRADFDQRLATVDGNRFHGNLFKMADVVAGDLVLLLPGNAVELRDGTKIVQREYAIARVRD